MTGSKDAGAPLPAARIVTDKAEALAYLIEVITGRIRIFNAMEDVAGAEAYIAGFPREHSRALAASIWRVERARYRLHDPRRPDGVIQYGEARY